MSTPRRIVRAAMLQHAPLTSLVPAAQIEIGALGVPGDPLPRIQLHTSVSTQDQMLAYTPGARVRSRVLVSILAATARQAELVALRVFQALDQRRGTIEGRQVHNITRRTFSEDPLGQDLTAHQAGALEAAAEYLVDWTEPR